MNRFEGKPVMKRCLLVTCFVVLGVSGALTQLSAQQSAPQSAFEKRVGSIKSIDGNTVTITTDSGSTAIVNVQATTKIVRVAPGQTDLKTAAPVELKALQVGDRVLVSWKASDTAQPVSAMGIVLMKSADIDAKQPADAGPSLEVTMQFIQDKLNATGKVGYILFDKDAAVGSPNTHYYWAEDSNFVADQNQCRISFHFKYVRDGSALKDLDLWFLLRSVQDMVVAPLAQYQWDVNAAGRPKFIEASTTKLLVRTSNGGRYDFLFSDADLADRVAKALTHAVELCGGGKEPEPF
jgi:hypothetical protein